MKRPDRDASQPPAPPIRGKVFALKDGSGYAALGSDGQYYRVANGRGQGLAVSLASSYVAASMVNVARGPVSGIAAPPPGSNGQDSVPPDFPHAAKAAHDQLPRRKAHPAATPGTTAEIPAIKSATHAAESSQTARALIAHDPAQAMSSQANLSPESAVTLLR